MNESPNSLESLLTFVLGSTTGPYPVAGGRAYKSRRDKYEHNQLHFTLSAGLRLKQNLRTGLSYMCFMNHINKRDATLGSPLRLLIRKSINKYGNIDCTCCGNFIWMIMANKINCTNRCCC